MSITDGVLLDQGGAVFNVKSSAYGAKGDGTTDDTKAIQKALNAAGAAGGTVFIPQGTYLLSGPLNVPTDTNVQGVGERSLLTAATSKVKAFLSLEGVSDVHICDLAIDVNTAIQYVQGIQIDAGASGGCRNVWVERCHIFNSQKVPSHYTMMAIDVASSSDIWIRDNHVVEMQIKAAGARGAQRVVVTGNQVRNPYQYGISFVSSSKNLKVGGVVADCVIADNVITEIGQAGGIYFGCDQSGQVKIVCERISVTGNVLSGNPPTRGAFIRGAVCPTSKDWIIQGNIARCTTTPPQEQTVGILIMGRETPGAVENLVIADNVVAGMDAGILLTGGKTTAGATGFVVQGNTVENTQGIEVSGSAYSLGRITGNVVRGGSIQLEDCGPVDVHDNTVQTGASAAVVVQTSGAGKQVTASVATNRLLASTGGSMGSGVKETGQGTFQTRYFSNLVAGNTGPALALASPEAAQLFNAYAGSLPVRQLSGSTSTAAQSVAAGATVTETIAVPDASIGDGVTVSSTAISTPGWQVNALVTAAGTVTVSITNQTGAAATLPAGTLNALVWGY